jgi:transcription antitermination factor NusG
MYWTCARLEPHRERLAVHCLGVNGYEVYLPRLRERRVSHGRRIEVRPPLFPGYAFVLIHLQWHAARWAPGTLGLIMDGTRPAKVADEVIEEIRRREVDGLIDLPKPPPLRRGARVRIFRGPFTGHLAIFADMRPRQRVEILLLTRRRAEGDARQEGHRSGTLTRSARSVNSSNDAACGCPAMMRSRVGSKYPMQMDMAFSAPIVNVPAWRARDVKNNHLIRGRSLETVQSQNASFARLRHPCRLCGRVRRESRTAVQTVIQRGRAGANRMLLTRLCEGQKATVLTLPTQAKTANKEEAQQRVASVG